MQPKVPVEMANRFLKVKMTRSLIGLPQKHTLWAKQLGLARQFQTVYVPINPMTVGSALKLKELTRVKIVQSKPKRINHAYPKGYEVIGSLLQE